MFLIFKEPFLLPLLTLLVALINETTLEATRKKFLYVISPQTKHLHSAYTLKASNQFNLTNS